MHKVGCKSIVWKGIDTIPAKKIHSRIGKESANSKLGMSLEGDPGSFKVVINFNFRFKKTLPEGQRGILFVKTWSDYLEFYHQNERSPDLALSSLHLANTFTEIKAPLSDLDLMEILDLLELVNSQDDLRRIVTHLSRSSLTPSQIESIISYSKKEGDNYYFLRKNLLIQKEQEIPKQLSETSADKIAEQAKSRLFLPVFKQRFPWIEMLQAEHELLCCDKSLNDAEPYMMELQGDLNESRKPMEEWISDFTDTQKVTLIIGGPGSGKTLFFMKYIRARLANYQEGQPLLIYRTLRSIKNPKTNLIEEILEGYTLNIHPYTHQLKRVPIILFLDGYDFLDNTFELFNLYAFNDLEKNWPLLKLVINCRERMLFSDDINGYFAPCGKNITPIHVAPLGQADIEVFLEKYLAYKAQSSHSSLMSKESYLAIINKLDISNFICNPFYLKLIIDHLSDLCAVSSIKESNLSDIRHSLLEGIAYASIMRDAEKAPDGTTPRDYCQALLEISQLMQICGKSTVSKGRLKEEEKCKRKTQHSSLLVRIRVEESAITEYNSLLENSANEEAERLQQEISSSKNVIAKCQKEITEIETLENAEQRLKEYLFSPSYRYLQTSALIAVNDKDEREFAHPVWHEFFSRLIKNEEDKQRFLDLYTPYTNKITNQ